jgi:hypothetical protein
MELMNDLRSLTGRRNHKHYHTNNDRLSQTSDTVTVPSSADMTISNHSTAPVPSNDNMNKVGVGIYRSVRRAYDRACMGDCESIDTWSDVSLSCMPQQQAGRRRRWHDSYMYTSVATPRPTMYNRNTPNSDCAVHTHVRALTHQQRQSLACGRHTDRCFLIDGLHGARKCRLLTGQCEHDGLVEFYSQTFTARLFRKYEGMWPRRQVVGFDNLCT